MYFRLCISGRADDGDGPRGAAVPVELHPGDDPRRSVGGADVALHGGVRGALQQDGHHGQRKVSGENRKGNEAKAREYVCSQVLRYNTGSAIRAFFSSLSKKLNSSNSQCSQLGEF